LSLFQGKNLSKENEKKMEIVSIAQTKKEWEAIYRLRYQIYVEELKRDYPEVDHKRKWLKDEDDESQYAICFYTGTIDNMTGTQRLLNWPPGKCPKKYFDLFSLELFSGIENLRTVELGRLMITETARGQLIFPSLMYAMYEYLVKERVDLAFLYCVPGLIRHYRKIGARPYSGNLIEAGSSTGIPLVIVPSDYEYFNSAGSLLWPLAKNFLASGFGKKLDTRHFDRLFEGDDVPVKLEPELVWSEVQRHLVDQKSTQDFIDLLPADSLRQLTESGFILELSPGDIVAKEGTEEKEIYVILEGVFEVTDQGHRLSTLEKGDLFGEIAFFNETGKRSASVRAISKGELLVLRRNFLKELTSSNPEAGFQILVNMGQIMSQRIINLTHDLTKEKQKNT
jgi:CRP-like cAMP-binding protein/predicted GNAT family N-acyltransferase